MRQQKTRKGKRVKTYPHRCTVNMTKEMRTALRNAKKDRKVSYAQLLRDAVEHEYGDYFNI